MNINYIQTKAELDRFKPRIPVAAALGLDTETSGYTPRVGDVSLLQVATTPEDVAVINVRKLKDQGEDFQFLDDALSSDQVVVFQNAKFDLQFMQKLLSRRLRVKNLNDTMLSSILLAFGDKSQRHSLGVISERFLGEAMEKDLQRSDFSGPEFSEAQIHYAGKDAAQLLRIRKAQGERITEEGLRRTARIEFDAVATMAEMEYVGMNLDTRIWTERARANSAEYVRLEDEILNDVGSFWPQQSLFGPPNINLASPHQVKELLHLIGVMIPNTDEDTLKEYQDYHPVIPKIIEFRDKETANKKFGENYLKFVDTDTGAIHSSFRQIEAPTGRMSSTQPNLMQLPATGSYRDAFTARYPGGKIITADFSQIELRIMASLSGDPVLREAFINGEDLHNKTAHLVLGEPLDNPNKARRVIAKNLNFGTAYGAQAKTFARLANVSVGEAEKMLKDFWNVYKVLNQYLSEQGSMAAHSGLMQTASGRKGKLLLDLQDPEMRSRAERLGRNFSIQGTGADILKIALYLVRQNFLAKGLDAYVVNVVHDEIVVEAHSNAEEAAAVLESSMIEAAMTYLGDIPCKVDVKVRDFWCK